MRFTATEAGFKDGLGGASNAKGADKRHYVLFGAQEDSQHPENSGVYFEYDDQSNGAVNTVKVVSMGNKSVVFKLKSGESIEVQCNVSAEEWSELKRGICAVFPQSCISYHDNAGVPPTGELEFSGAQKRGRSIVSCYSSFTRRMAARLGLGRRVRGGSRSVRRDLSPRFFELAVGGKP